MPDLAVAIVSWNVRELLAGCLNSLSEDLNRSGLDAEVWVVDNASTDGSPEMVAEVFPAVHVIASEENLGFAAGNNLALRNLRSAGRSSPFVWLLNPDTEILPAAAAELLSALKANPRRGVAGAKLLYPDGSLQHSAFRFPGLAQLAFELFPLPSRLYDTPLNGRYPRRLYEGNTPFPVDHPLGAAMMVRTEAIEQVGLMDEGYHMYCEEIDWCWRMQQVGWGALCVPTARVIHHAGRSTGQVAIRSFINLWTSRARLYARHHGPIRRWLARVMVRAGMQRRMRRASPRMVIACQRVIETWEETR
ncbi:MAG: glycosyltransferase family 2 protein [Anaerolineae bacterium]